ncbi:MAG TPA: ADP-ribosylglycohydrolase family protein [Nocardioides sp.]|nr:ADP-ribosylglycohydrolase family protein [Nocardioides sp.]
MEEVRHRTRAAVRGLAEADAITWTAWWHRMSHLPPRRAVRLSQGWHHARDQLTTSLPTPYLQSSSPSLVDPAGPTDNTEWFVVGVRAMLGQQLDGTPADDRLAVWRSLAAVRAEEPEAVRGRIATTIALANLATGLEPPASGNDNPHYFDDSVLVRAVAAGLLRPGQPLDAAALAAEDGQVTHALDGVWGARAVAALVAVLVDGGDRAAAVAAARDQLPDGSWISSVVAECLGCRPARDAPLVLGAALEREVVDHVYAFANQAPETLGLLLAHLQGAASAEALLLGALSHPRHADALVPLAGALAGLCFPGTVDDEVEGSLDGVCVRALAGVRLDTVAAAIEDAVVGARS